MDKPQKWLSTPKLDFVLDNRNNPIRAADFAKKLETNLQLRDQYLCNIEIWFNYLRKQLQSKKINPQLIENKLSELLQIAKFFPKEKWPRLYQSIGQMERLIKEEA